MKRFIVVFGWYVVANDKEQARELAKQNLAYENERKPVDYFRVKEVDSGSDQDVILD